MYYAIYTCLIQYMSYIYEIFHSPLISKQTGLNLPQLSHEASGIGVPGNDFPGFKLSALSSPPCAPDVFSKFCVENVTFAMSFNSLSSVPHSLIVNLKSSPFSAFDLIFMGKVSVSSALKLLLWAAAGVINCRTDTHPHTHKHVCFCYYVCNFLFNDACCKKKEHGTTWLKHMKYYM
eukprot:GHVR01120682.1.p1 GENE.GHVR01120682.1~~GHVR01120682.1.p1  ORF type:complete len:177 (+),score=15.73 GHVR01120682.1:340-870(+)